MALYLGPGVPYDQGRMRTLVAPALLALTLAPALADAKPKTAAGGTVCGVAMLPLAVGNTWTYSTVAAPMPATPDIARISPPLPKGFVITVKSIENQGGDTVVTLEEKVTYDLTKDAKKPVVDERVITSTITCNAKKFDISPESFFFAGEPGGFAGITIDKLERKGTSWQLTKGKIGENEWPEDLMVTWTRKPVEGAGARVGTGKLEMERRFTPQEPESVVTKTGTYKAEKLAVQTTGRVTLDSPLTASLPPAEMPADWVNQLWIVEGTGVVQSLNRYAHMYQLVDSQLK